MSDTERLYDNEAESAAEEEKDTQEVTAEADAPEQTPEDNTEVSDSAVDYAALAEEDMRYLITVFPDLEGKRSVAELDNPLRYAALRDLGLSPIEAYLATNYKARAYDNRSHLQSAVPKRASASAELLGARELEAARELFAGLSDREIQRLYRKVSK